ncbi:MAG TPA: hypothetical protein PKV98_04460 [Burkholderiaceae bacterium]|nr:hypothetical protein [Burkholderiaceae bacterium]
MNTVTARVTNSYGNLVAYPTNQPAKLLAAVAGTRTLRPVDLARAEALGFGIALDGSYADVSVLAAAISAIRPSAVAV